MRQRNRSTKQPIDVKMIENVTKTTGYMRLNKIKHVGYYTTIFHAVL